MSGQHTYVPIAQDLFFRFIFPVPFIPVQFCQYLSILRLGYLIFPIHIETKLLAVICWKLPLETPLSEIRFFVDHKKYKIFFLLLHKTIAGGNGKSVNDVRNFTFYQLSLDIRILRYLKSQQNICTIDGKTTVVLFIVNIM